MATEMSLLEPPSLTSFVITSEKLTALIAT